MNIKKFLKSNKNFLFLTIDNYKNIIIPMPNKESKEETVEFKSEEENSLQVVNKNIFEKIKNFLKKIFGQKSINYL